MLVSDKVICILSLSLNLFPLSYILALSVVASCKDTSDAEEQTIYSPNYPSSYLHSKHCTWKISAPIGKRLKLDSFSYRIEDHSSCTYDSLKIYDGPNSHSSRKARLCGYSTYHATESTGNHLYLKFDSDGSTSSKGFKIHYSILGISFFNKLFKYSLYITV